MKKFRQMLGHNKRNNLHANDRGRLTHSGTSQTAFTNIVFVKATLTCIKVALAF